MKSLFEQMGGTYHEENGYLIPNLTLPDEEQVEIGIWGQHIGGTLNNTIRYDIPICLQAVS